jgi:hypothetical protein
MLAWAEDRALLRSTPSADPGAKTGARAEHTPALRFLADRITTAPGLAPMRQTFAARCRDNQATMPFTIQLHRSDDIPFHGEPRQFRFQIGLEDWLQDQHRSHLDHAISYAGNSERPQLAITFRYEHASDRPGTIRFLPELFRQFVQPAKHAVLLDRGKALAVNPRCTTVVMAACVGEAQNIPVIDLVVQRVESIVGRVLRFGVQCRLQLPNLNWR